MQNIAVVLGQGFAKAQGGKQKSAQGCAGERNTTRSPRQGFAPKQSAAQGFGVFLAIFNIAINQKAFEMAGINSRSLQATEMETITNVWALAQNKYKCFG